MTCKEVINEFLMAYLDGELPLAQRAKFEMHMSVCSSCRHYLDSYRKTVDLSREASKGGDKAALPPPPEELVRAILAAASEKKT